MLKVYLWGGGIIGIVSDLTASFSPPFGGARQGRPKPVSCTLLGLLQRLAILGSHRETNLLGKPLRVAPERFMGTKQPLDRESRPATRLSGQNVRGLTSLKLEKVIQFMKDHEILVTSLMESWRVTPNGVECEE